MCEGFSKKTFKKNILPFALGLLVLPFVHALLGDLGIGINYDDHDKYIAIPLYVTFFSVLTISRYKFSLKLSLFWGAFTGVIMALTTRIGLTLGYLFVSSNKKMGLIEFFFKDYGLYFFVIVLWSIFCMAVLFFLAARRQKRASANSDKS